MKIFLTFLSVISCLTCLYGQTLTVENNRQTAVISFSDRALKVSEEFAFKTASNYKFYELTDPKGINIRAVPLDNVAVQTVFVLQNGFRLNLELNQSLDYGKIYLLKINNAQLDGRELPVLRLELSKEPTLKAFNDPRNRMRLESNVEISEKKVSVKETILKVSADKTSLEVLPVAVPVEVQKVTPTQMNIKFKDALSEARNHYFNVELQADDGTPLKTKGKVFVPGLPPPSATPKIEVKLSSEFGGGLKPQFNLAGVIKNTFAKSDNDLFYFEPILTFDVGLGATKSKNFISLELPILKYSVEFPHPSGCRVLTPPNLKGDFADVVENPKMTEGKKDSVPLPCYSEWSRRHPLSLYSIDLKIGPKFETDRKFSRINALGTIQFDFNFDRWQRSIANQRSYLEADLKNTAYRNNFNDVWIKTGFTITPRLGFEFGRKLTAEVIKNKTNTIRHIIPSSPILRAYTGISAEFEFNYGFLPMKLTLNQDLFYLASAESSGEFKSNVLNIRRVRGFHPLGRASLDIALDPAKRYNFNITFENGRSAPNFEYLNTVKTGLRIIY